MSEVHRQTCQSCGGREHRIFLIDRPGSRTHAVVQCVHCGQLVARYGLDSYYHHGKGYESWLKRQGINAWSPKEMHAAFEKSVSDAEADFRIAQDHATSLSPSSPANAHEDAPRDNLGSQNGPAGPGGTDRG